MNSGIVVEPCLDRASWLARRNSGIGSSDALTIAYERHGRARHTLYSLWATKSGLAPHDDSDESRFIEWGNRIEPILVEWAAEQTGIAFLRRPHLILRNRTREYLIASPDALFGPTDAPVEGLEVKTADKKFADEWGDEPPLHYRVQVQHQLLVTGLARWHVAALIGGNDPRLYVVERDERFLAAYARAAERFWRRVLDGNPPPMLGRSPEDRVLAHFFPAETPGARIVLPPEAIHWHAQKVAAEASKEAAETRIAESKIRLAALMGAAEVGELPDDSGVIYTYKTEHRRAYVKTVPEWSDRVLRSRQERRRRRSRAGTTTVEA